MADEFIRAARNGNERALHWMAVTATADEWHALLVAIDADPLRATKANRCRMVGPGRYFRD